MMAAVKVEAQWPIDEGPCGQDIETAGVLGLWMRPGVYVVQYKRIAQVIEVCPCGVGAARGHKGVEPMLWDDFFRRENEELGSMFSDPVGVIWMGVEQ